MDMRSLCLKYDFLITNVPNCLSVVFANSKPAVLMLTTTLDVWSAVNIHGTRQSVLAVATSGKYNKALRTEECCI